MTSSSGTATLTGSFVGASASYIAEIVGRRLGPYRLERVLGSGGMGTVYSAVDERYGTRVAVKAVPASIDETRLRALKREFRTICEFSHPHVVEMYDLGTDELGLYTAMELIDGVAFVPFLLQPCEAERRRERLLRAAGQLAQGLAALHGAGFVHRDLKSANVLVEQGSERVVILDFGLAEARQDPESAEERALGTPSHMAPELLQGGRASTASDWFALGVTLYEVLVGKPSRGQPLRERAQVALAARDGWERELLAVVVDLLHPEASKRPGAAQVLERLGLPPLATPRHVDELVGREAELRELDEIWSSVRAGQGATVALSGAPGVGKSFLARCFLERLEREGAALVCRSRCHVNERIPFNAADRLVETLARYAATTPLTYEQPSAFAAVAELFPALGDVNGFHARAGAEPKLQAAERRVLAFGVLRRLVTELARARPLVLFVDDAHWADADSAQLLQEVCGAGQGTTPGVLLLWTERAGGRDRGFLREMARDAATRTLEVSPLAAEAATRLARACLPERSPTDVSELVREASGNPLVLVKAAQRAGATAAEPGGMLKALVDSDLADVAPPLRRLIRILAIASAPLAIDVAFQAADAGQDVHRALAALRRAHLIALSSSSSEEKLELYHETLRAPLSVELTTDELASLHGALARTLEASPGASRSLLAAHFHGARQDDKAACYAEQAGAEAAGALAFAAAAQHFRDALAWQRPERAHAAALRGHLAQALFDAGYCAEAAEIYAEQGEGSAPEAAQRVAVRQATAWFSAGYVDRGVACVAATLEQLRIAAPRDRWLMPAIALQVLQLRLRGASYALSAGPHDEARAFRADVCWSMGQGMSMFLSRQGAYFALRSLREAGPLGDPRRIGRGLAFLGGICANLGASFAAFGQQCLDSAEAIGERHDDLVVLGWTHVWRANTKLVGGRFHEAFALAEAGTEAMERGGYAMSWECHTARCFALMARERLGDLLEVEQRALEVLRRANARRDSYGNVVFGLFVAQIQLARGKPAQALELADQAMRGWTDRHFTIQHFYALRLRVLERLYRGDVDGAWQELSGAWHAVQHSDAGDVPSARLDSLVLRSQVELALAARGGAERRAHLRSARKLRIAAEKASEEGRAHAQLLAASEERLSGSSERAAALARGAAATFERLGMALWRRLALRAERCAAADAAGVAEQEAELTRLGVGEPARWAAAVTPGF